MVAPPWFDHSVGVRASSGTRLRRTFEGTVIGEAAARAQRCNMIGVVEPGEEREFLEMVIEPVRHCDTPVIAEAAQWITHFQIVLPAAGA